MSSSTTTAGEYTPWIRWSWQRGEHHPALTGMALAALAAASTMAVFGLPPVDLHGPLHHIGIMDPLCGGTRAAFYTARGDFALAWRYNPLGVLVVAGALVLVVRTAVGLITRRWLTMTLSWTRRRWWLATVTALLLLAALAVRQQLRADLLIAGT